MNCPVTFSLSIEQLYGLPAPSVPKAPTGILVSAPAVPAIMQTPPASAATTALPSNATQTLVRNLFICGAVVGVGIAAVYCYKQYQRKKQAQRDHQPFAYSTNTDTNPYIMYATTGVINAIE